MIPRVGGQGFVTVPMGSGTVRIKVRVLESRQNWGRTDFKVQPLLGEGEVWVQEQTLEGDSD